MPSDFAHPLHDEPQLGVDFPLRAAVLPDRRLVNPLKVYADFAPAGDQPQAIARLTDNLNRGARDQTLLGVTGSGKTFTMAQVIAATQRPALVLAPNKTLAAQLYGEFAAFFPDNAVEYFVSYYDYYQPEAYVARTDTYIEKESTVNERIDRMRHAATRALLERKDVIVVASVSCLYGIGDVATYASMTAVARTGETLDREDFLRRLVAMQYRRNDMELTRGTFRARGDVIEIHPSHSEDRAWRVALFDDEVETITEFDPLTGQRLGMLEEARIYPNSHYVAPRPTTIQAIATIRAELNARLDVLRDEGALLEAQRLEQRGRYDLENLEATGFCSGVENYSRHLTGRAAGQPPPTLFEYLPDDALLFVDESHVAIPQLRGAWPGDWKRKETLARHGFRLPSCVDNRPLRFAEWDAMRPQTICVSATPGPWEQARHRFATPDGSGLAEQIVRPTGLVDPATVVRPAATQVDDLLAECKASREKGERVLVTALTKRMAENLAEHLHEHGVRARYMHADIDTLERMEIIRDLRLGAFDALVGINLLREGLDIPECALVAILDADREGFLRSETSLIQTVGRAARHVHGRAILYADVMTNSMTRALAETSRRRALQEAHNAAQGITPRGVIKAVGASLYDTTEAAKAANREETQSDRRAQRKAWDKGSKKDGKREGVLSGEGLRRHIEGLNRTMLEAAADLEFERAAKLRDKIRDLTEAELLILDPNTPPRPRAQAGRAGTRALKAKNTKHRTKPTLRSQG